MRIGLNLLFLIPGINGGTETYAAGLLAGLHEVGADDEFVVFVNQEASDWPLPESPRFQRVVCPIQATNRFKKYWYEQVSFPAVVRASKVELLHSLAYVAPLRPGCRSILTIPDLNYLGFGALMSWYRRLALATFVSQAAKRSEKVIAISDFTRQELMRELGLPPDRVVAIHLAPKAMLAEKKCAAPIPGIDPTWKTIVAFSHWTPNKNIARLLSAFEMARQKSDLPHHLVLIGHPPPQKMSAQNVHYTGYIKAAQVEYILQHSEALVFPSIYEGFGLPLLEAMRAQVAVVSSNAASLPEVAGEAAVFFDPTSVEDMASKIALVATDTVLRKRLVEAGSNNLKRFSWRETARRTTMVYHGL
jgi:glycosyltransferase involved in cell wall biosynthesis